MRAIQEGKTRYTSPSGTPSLRKAIAEKLARENGIVVPPGDVLVASGAKQAIYVLLAAAIDPGDEVIIPAPYWVSYPEQVKLLGGVPRIVASDERTRFRLPAAALRLASGPRTRCVILNTPVNPTGAVYSREELAAIAEVVVEKDLLLITDEIYEKILYDGVEHVSTASLGKEIAARTATVHGVSKAYAMTGWRIGYAAGPHDWIDAAGSIQSHLAGNACSVSQEATEAALLGAATDIDRMRESFARRRALVLSLLAGARDLTICPPLGTFYAFPDVSAYFGRRAGEVVVNSAQDIAAYLLEEAKVAIVPGEAFASPRHLRISFATSDEILTGGLGAMVEALNRLR
ncbi:MAG: pyridoxal phosphate-dependent aminotransferase [Candidatus Eisenbacteria bacterium]